MVSSIATRCSYRSQARALGLILLLAGCRAQAGPAPVVDAGAPAPDGVEWSLASAEVLRLAPDRMRPPRGAKLPEGFVSTRLAFPTGAIETSVLLLERLAPAEVTIGQPFGYELRLTNLTDLRLDNVAVREYVGEGFQLEGTQPAATSAVDGEAVWVFERLGPREVRTLRLKGYPQGIGELHHFATVDYNALVSSSIRVVSPSLRLRLSGPSESLLCRDVPLRLVVTNAGERPAFAIGVRGALPEGLYTADGARRIEFEIDRLKVGESQSFELPLQAGDPGSYLVRIDAAVRGGGDSPSNVFAFAVREPVLNVALSGDTRRAVGQRMTQRVRVLNSGDAAAPKTLITYRVPPGANVVTASDGGRLTGQTVVWRIDGLEVGDEREFEVVLNALRSGLMEAHVDAVAECAERRESALELVISGPTPLTLALADSVDPVAPGGNLNYAVMLRNAGADLARGVRLEVRLPAGLEFLGTEGASPGSAADGWVRFDEVPELEAGGELRWRLLTRVPVVEELAPSVLAARRFDVRARVEVRGYQGTLEASETTGLRGR